MRSSNCDYVAAPPQRVVFDLSHTYNSPHQTGIQRVVRSLLRELPQVCDELGMTFVAVVWKDDGFVPLESALQSPEEVASSGVREIRQDVLAHCPRFYRSAAQRLCGVVGSKILRKWLLPEPGHLGLFSLPLKIAAAFPRRVKARRPDHIVLGERDLLILPDGYWVIMHIWPAVTAARRAGARVTAIIYDLICVTHPQFFFPSAKKNFTKFLIEVSRNVDVTAAISQTVKGQLDEKLPQMTPANQQIPQRCSFQLGAEFSRADGTVRGEIVNLFADNSSAIHLMVATFEPRKNHAFALDTFDRLWETQPHAVLLLVGAVGWMSEAVLRRIAEHPQRNRRLFVFHDLSDSEVQYCYKHSGAVIFPSVVEGYGLPIVEALWHGRKVFASDTLIHREVGKDDCDYFQLDDADSLCHLLQTWNNSTPIKHSPQTPQPPCWLDSTRDLMRQVLCSLDCTEVQPEPTSLRTPIAV